MGNCIYCGNKAGLFKKKHSECEQKSKAGWDNMITEVRQAAISGNGFDTLQNKLTEIAQASFIPTQKVKEAMVKGWEQAVDHFLEDDILHVEEERQLVSFIDHFGLSQDELDLKGSFSKVVKAAVIRDLVEGKLPQRVKLDSPLSFNFQKDETIVWVFAGVQYFEDRIRRQYVGGYQGFSVRVARGVYYRTGGFKGTPIEHTERVHVDTGILTVTNKHIYFGGARKSFRVAFKKIVSFEPMSDAIGIMRDAATAKGQFFRTGDGWFTYNLFTNLASL